MKLLICGGRDYHDQATVSMRLDEIHAQEGPITLLIQGGAIGADKCAFEWSKTREVPCVNVPAKWNKHKKAAGPIRNQYMLDEFEPDKVLAFPGGSGTANMVSKAKKHGIPVEEL